MEQSSEDLETDRQEPYKKEPCKKEGNARVKVKVSKPVYKSVQRQPSKSKDTSTMKVSNSQDLCQHNLNISPVQRQTSKSDDASTMKVSTSQDLCQIVEDVKTSTKVAKHVPVVPAVYEGGDGSEDGREDGSEG